MSGMHLSKEFFELLKSIGESKSKQEEDRIIVKEVQTLKKKLETPASRKKTSGLSGSNALSTNKKKAKEFLVRMLYVEMLGHDASFGYIKAVELAASSSIMHKRTGYLVCASVLSPEHEFRFMLVNQMQRDLASNNVLVVIAALLAATSIITGDMAPAISGEVSKLLGHSSDQVRKKAIIALHRLYQIAPEIVTHEEVSEKLRRHLCDRDPSVMGSSLNVIEALAMSDPKPFKDLVPSLTSILKQIIEHRLPSDFDYHRVPAPWMQLKIVRILAILGKNDANASNGMYEMLSECLKRADVGINAGYAIVYECVRTITEIYPNPTLLDSAADAISRFISSRSHNLKYMGITGLAGIVESHPACSAAHQVAVIECLEDTDETLQRRTLELLYKMTNPVNVEFITEKMLDFLRGTTEIFLRKDLTQKVCHLAERHAPNNIWYVQTTTNLFEISGDLMKPDVAQNLMTLIAEGEEDDEEADMLLRQHAVEIYAVLLDRPTAKLPQLLIETMAWVLGEYAYLSAEYTLDEILEKLCAVVRKGKDISPSTRKILITAIMKLVAQAGTCPPQAAKVIDDFTKSKDVDLQQRCLEFQNMLTSAANILGEVLPVDASCEDVDVDINLEFLDGFVGNALANGAQEYKKPDDDDDDDEFYGDANPTKGSAFKMTPYDKPTQPGSSYGKNMRGMGSNTTSVPGISLPPGAGYNSTGAAAQTNQSVIQESNEPQLNLRNVANVWGKGGMSQTPTTAAAPTTNTDSGFQSTSLSAAPATNISAPSASWSNSYTPTTQQPQESVKTEEQLRKEKMAAALFGGTVPGATVKESFRSSVPVRKQKSSVPESAPPAPPVTAPLPPPAPEIIDLLDFGSDPIPSAAPPTNFDVDILTPSPIIATEFSPLEVGPAPTTVPTSEPAGVSDDPFASAGLLGDFGDTTLDGLMTDSRFEFSGTKLSPLEIDTAQFGQQWGSCSASSSISETTTNVENLDKLMYLFVSLGLSKVETITATNEGICAGMVGGSNITLVHAKLSPLGGGSSKIDITVKATDQSMAGCLSMFIQNMLR